MASEIDICNLALSHLGQSRQITAISPPDGSAEAALCARYYPFARDMMLEEHTWGFATRRVALALSGTASPKYEYSYAWPNQALKIQSILLEDSDIPQSFAVESTVGGTFIYTDAEDAYAKYTVRVTDTNKFSNIFRMAISELLASFLAGPIIKGKAGQEVARALRSSAFTWYGRAALHDAEGQADKVQNPPGYESTRIQSPSRRARN